MCLEDDLYSVVFSVFDKFQILQEYHITASKLIYFLTFLSFEYTNPKIVSFRNAVDSLQFLAHILLESKYYRMVQNEQILSLFLSVIFHGTMFPSFDNKFSLLGAQLFNDTLSMNPIYETHSCYCLSQVISYESCNILANINTENQKQILSTTYSLIMSGSFSQNNIFMTQFRNNILDSSQSITTGPSALLFMQLLIKVSIVSLVTRPFEIANNGLLRISKKLLLTANIDSFSSLQFTSQYNKDRFSVNVEKSALPIINGIVNPLVSVLPVVFPDLNHVSSQILSNLEKWGIEITVNPPDMTFQRI